ncbi:hypothetical protein V5O48_008400, partial [Marasmius crinis-equi]
MADSDPTFITPALQGRVSVVGRSLAADVVNLACESGLWAIYLCLFTWALCLQLPRTVRNPSVAGVGVLGVTLLLFISSTVLWVMEIVHPTGLIKTCVLGSSDVSLNERLETFNKQELLMGIVEEVLFMTN